MSSIKLGPLAQLVERCIRIAEISGSIPLRSTRKISDVFVGDFSLVFCPPSIRAGGGAGTVNQMVADLENLG